MDDRKIWKWGKEKEINKEIELNGMDGKILNEGEGLGLRRGRNKEKRSERRRKLYSKRRKEVNIGWGLKRYIC